MTPLANEPLIVSREWPWGLAFIRDSRWAEPPPLLSDAPVAATRGEIVTKMAHQIDGQATLAVMLERPDDLALVHETDLEVPSGTLVVSDAADERVVRAELPAGTWRAAIWMDDTESPSRVVISLHLRA